MNINIGNIPKAILYYLLGVVVMIVFYYIFSPAQVDLLGILEGMGLYTMEDSVKQILWFGIMMISVLVSLGYPTWMLFEDYEENANE